MRRFVLIGFVLALTSSALGPVHVAHASAGAQLWIARYNGRASGGDDTATAMVASPDGAVVFVTGNRQGRGSNGDIVTIAYDAYTGTKIWLSRYSGPLSDGQDQAIDLAVSPDGSRIYVTGNSQGPGGAYDYVTLAYDAETGARFWARRLNSTGDDFDFHIDFPDALAVSPDGAKVYVTGNGLRSGSYFDYETVAYDAIDGTAIWVRRYDGPGHGFDRASALAVSSDGATLYVTGGSTLSAASYTDYLTVAYAAATGKKIWARAYRGPGQGQDRATDMALSPDGGTLYLTGMSYRSGTDYDYATVALDSSTGVRMWASRYDGPDSLRDIPSALASSPDGTSLYVTGQSLGSGSDFPNTDYATVALDAASGARLWVRRYDGPAGHDDIANALAVSPDGASVYVTGESSGRGFQSACATVAYDGVTGNRLWAQRYNGPTAHDDRAFALALSPDGSRVFVTGESYGSGTYYDFATIAYAAGGSDSRLPGE